MLLPLSYKRCARVPDVRGEQAGIELRCATGAEVQGDVSYAFACGMGRAGDGLTVLARGARCRPPRRLACAWGVARGLSARR